MRSKPIHPFPARMAPEIALGVCVKLAADATVLDPMAGSGTVLRAAAEQGLRGIGFDMDPLAVLLSKVWTTPIEVSNLEEAAADLVQRAQKLNVEDAPLPWIDEHEETLSFVKFWFGKKQRDDLRRLCFLLQDEDDSISNILRVAISRLIITKERGASLAADVSHSRPHRVYMEKGHDYDVFKSFIKSVKYIVKRLKPERLKGNVTVMYGDARQLNIEDESVDAIITSPPYLNAIDYLRGHRLALVWLGYQIDLLRLVRSRSMGAERKPDPEADLELAKELTASIDPKGKLKDRRRQMINRYALDIHAFMQEAYRVLKHGGEATLVVGNSTHRGVYVENTTIVTTAAEHVGFEWLRDRTHKRPIPPSRRYLPPPSKDDESALKRRMREEMVLTLRKN
ncbi:MAG: hypothetical protein KatS3mg043_0334 [Rhodothermaceae bacterium]|nr:MAG: hypothetical protein KatS3mg043_0334 [Rhodothermaceae bacterium]